MSSNKPDWMSELAGMLAAGDGHGGYLVKFPIYRPDLAKALAHHLGLEFFDFRAEVMSRLGTSAHTLELDAIGRSLRSRAAHRGLLAFNLEALLGTKAESARQAWFGEFVRGSYRHPVVVPLAVFCSDVDASLPNIFTLDPESLPEQSLISRLAT